MKKPLRRLLSMGAVATLLSASCILVSNPEGEPGWRTIPGSEARTSGSEFRRTVAFAPGRALTLENDYGNVEITGWDRDEAEVVARGAAAGAAPRVEVRETDQGLLIRTPTFEGPGDASAVDYEVRVPNSVELAGIRISEGNLSIADVFGRIEASIEKGNLSVSNYSGPLRATIGTGSADVEVLDLRDADEITVTTRRGDITLSLEAGVNAIVEADAPRGEVRSDFDLGVKLPVTTVKGWIGQGGPAILLRASNGRIEIVKVKSAPGAPPRLSGE